MLISVNFAKLFREAIFKDLLWVTFFDTRSFFIKTELKKENKITLKHKRRKKLETKESRKRKIYKQNKHKTNWERTVEKICSHLYMQTKIRA